MGVIEFPDTQTSPVPAAKPFKAMFVDNHIILPKVVPNLIKSIDLVEGDGGSGSIKHITSAEGVPIKYVKYKIDVLDESGLSYADTQIEGGALSDQVEKVTNVVQFVSTPDGGCSANTITRFYTKEGANVTEDEHKAVLEGAYGIFKAVEAHLSEN